MELGDLNERTLSQISEHESVYFDNDSQFDEMENDFNNK